jgi:arsenite methyltransferase
MKTNQNKKSKKADYGQDMPGIILAVSILAVVLLALAFWQYHQYAFSHSNSTFTNSIILASIAVFFILIAFVGIWSSRSGKLLLRDKVISKLNFTGSESILDIGCGRGLLLLEVAKKIPNGKAIGADLWLGNIEYKNSPQMVLDNATIEGVSGRIEVVTADAQALPFNDKSFDIVMTSLMMHHISDIHKALNEMVRVLKPGGTLVIADVNSKRYAKMITALGLSQVEIHYATRLFLVPAYIVKGFKSN